MTPDPADPVLAAATAVAGLPDAAPAPGGKPKHRRPSEFEGNAYALQINEMLDSVDPAPENAKLANPATKFKVGQCAVATAAELSATPDLDIHPGWLLAFASAAYAGAVGIHFVANRKKPAAAPVEGRDLASLA